MKCFAALLILAATVGCQHRIKLYPGPKRDVSAIARVHNSAEIMVNAVDDQAIQSKLKFWQPATAYAGFVLELEPGEHRLTVSMNYVSPESGHWITDAYGNGMYVVDSPAQVVQLSANKMTLRHHFEAGKSYCFLMRTTKGPRSGPGPGVGSAIDGTWEPLLVEEGSTTVLATPETNLPPMVLPPASSSGGNVVTGIAQIPQADGRIYTATGEQVSLLPAVPAVRIWLEKTNKFNHSFWAWSAPKLPAELRKQVRTTRPIAQGHYSFTDVPPGDYVVLYICGKTLAIADVRVGPNDRHVIAKELRVLPYEKNK